jgi:hypothetical protein
MARRIASFRSAPFLRLVLTAAPLALAACGSVNGTDDLFGSPNSGSPGSGGSGGSGGAGPSSSHASSGSTGASSTSSTSSTSSATASSSSGGPVCGNGVCEPPAEDPVFCPQDCGGTTSATGSSSSSSGGGPCAHSGCDQGVALDPACDPCAATVCNADPFCCTNNWDGQCVSEASSLCNANCCGNAQCNVGEDCNSCATDCGACPGCGSNTCDPGEDCNSCPQDCGPCPVDPTCPHSVCFASGPLDPALCHDPCVDTVCAQMPSCCQADAWTPQCQQLQASCGADKCITSVCAVLPSCCTTTWDQACVDQAKTSCGTGCDCTHSICQQGQALVATCNPCAEAVCKVDDYCCNGGWDGLCVSEVELVCGIDCTP